MNLTSIVSGLVNAARRLVLVLVGFLLGLPGQEAVAQAISEQAVKQIQAFAADKEARTPAQRKIGSNLIYATRMNRGLPVVAGIPAVQTGIAVDAAGATVVDIRANVDDALLEKIHELAGEVLNYYIPFRSIRARMPLAALETLAADSKVIFIAPKQEAVTNRAAARALAPPSSQRPATVAGFSGRAERVRSQLSSGPGGGSAREALVVNTSEGVVTHRANLARYTFGAAGAGVKIGVLSDGVDTLAARQASGDLPTVTVLPGQAGSGDEGTAMLEIVHDVAPAAQLYFATAFNGIESFAANILALRAAGCDIIVDDVSYFAETPFQKGQAPSVVSTYNAGIVTQAVNDVTAGGALYFSSAANSGNKTDGTSGTWEGDYVDGGPAGGVLAGAGNVHNFGGGTLYDAYTATSDYGLLFWSDPLGASTNDYDLYALNAAGTSVVAASADVQDGTQDPWEAFSGTFAAGCPPRRRAVRGCRPLSPSRHGPRPDRHQHGREYARTQRASGPERLRRRGDSLRAGRLRRLPEPCGPVSESLHGFEHRRALQLRRTAALLLQPRRIADHARRPLVDGRTARPAAAHHGRGRRLHGRPGLQSLLRDLGGSSPRRRRSPRSSSRPSPRSRRHRFRAS